MDKAKKINLISILLVLISIIMIGLGIFVRMPAPALTGVGFLLIVWALQVLN